MVTAVSLRYGEGPKRARRLQSGGVLKAAETSKAETDREAKLPTSTSRTKNMSLHPGLRRDPTEPHGFNGVSLSLETFLAASST